MITIVLFLLVLSFLVPDLISYIKEKEPNAIIVLGGHSAGGGTAIRFAGTKYGQLIDAFLLLAPAVSPNAPVTI